LARVNFSETGGRKPKAKAGMAAEEEEPAAMRISSGRNEKNSIPYKKMGEPDDLSGLWTACYIFRETPPHRLGLHHGSYITTSCVYPNNL